MTDTPIRTNVRVHEACRAASVLALIAALGLGVPDTAAAQFAGMFRDSELAGADAELAAEAGGRLLASNPVAMGLEESWSNPATGASGIARISEFDDSGQCVVIRHDIRASASAETQTLRFRHCRDQSGAWKLTPVTPKG